MPRECARCDRADRRHQRPRDSGGCAVAFDPDPQAGPQVTAILTQRCDPFGMETERYGQRMAGGLFGEASAGNYKWHCQEPVTGRYRMICTGGDYGFRRQADGGLIAAYHCDGGHKGQVMALCRLHVRDFSTGPPKPGWSKDLRTPLGQIGGTKANELCPACVAPPEARTLMERANFLHAQLSAMMTSPLLNFQARIAAIESEQDQVRAALDELHERGIVHKCPLRLVEVS